MSEREQQIFFFSIIRLNISQHPRLALIHASMNGLYSASARMAADRKAQGQVSGVPDICVPLAGHWNKVQRSGAWIEMKFGRNGLSEEQDKFVNALRSEGWTVVISYSADQALDFIESYLGIKLRGRDVKKVYRWDDPRNKQK